MTELPVLNGKFSTILIDPPWGSGTLWPRKLKCQGKSKSMVPSPYLTPPELRLDWRTV